MKVEHTEKWHWTKSSAKEFAQRCVANKYINVRIENDTDEKNKRVYIVHADKPLTL